MSCSELERSYRTDYPNQGLALIFNLTFSNDTERWREGTSEDEQNFVESLIKLGFRRDEITVKADLTAVQIKTELSTVAKRDHTNNAMFMCAIFSHGTSNNLYDSNNELMLWSTLWENFTDDKCPSLKGKPKIFFIQACRGEKLDAGTEEDDLKKLEIAPKNTKLKPDTTDSKITTSLSPFQFPQTRQRYLSANYPEDFAKLKDPSGRRASAPVTAIPVPKSWYENPEPKTKSDFIFSKTKNPFIPTHTNPDILVASSCAPEHYSFRNKQTGSWFISAWHDVVMTCKDFEDCDLVQLLTKVNCKVGVDKESANGDFENKKQIPNFNSTLTKRVYFRNLG